MPGIGASIIKLQLWLTKPLARFAGIEAARAAQDQLGRITTKLLRAKVAYECVPFDEFTACFAVPCECEHAEDRVILYLHGGGYTAGSLDYAKGFGGLLAAGTRLTTFCAAYRLAPEHRFPAALDDAMRSYQYLLERGYRPEQIALAGESAGGGLAFCLALRCKAEGVPLPACIVGISPWADLTMSGPAYNNNVWKDPSLVRESLAYNVIAYAAGHEDEPYVSPVFGDLAGLPNALLFAGGSEILLDDARTLHKRLLAYGCKSQLVIERGLWHAYPLYGTRESRNAREHMSAFIRGELGLDSPSSYKGDRPER